MMMRCSPAHTGPRVFRPRYRAILIGPLHSIFERSLYSRSHPQRVRSANLRWTLPTPLLFVDCVLTQSCTLARPDHWLAHKFESVVYPDIFHHYFEHSLYLNSPWVQRPSCNSTAI